MTVLTLVVWCGVPQMLVSKDKEPITPFIGKVKALYSQLGISSILVIGTT
jgi:hypothetical protein